VKPCAIVGIGRTPYSRASGRTTLAMAAEACRGALDDAGLSPSDVDGITTFQNNDSALGHFVAHAFGAGDLNWNCSYQGGGNQVSSTVASAAAMIEAGHCKTVVVYRSLNGRSGYRHGSRSGPMQVDAEFQFSGPHGYLVPPQWFAMWARRHQSVYGWSEEALGHIAITERSHAVQNEHAIARKPLTMDDYLASRWVNEPLRVPDCSYEVDGAVAIVLAAPEIAADCPHDPVWLIGNAESHSGTGWEHWDDLTTMYSRYAGPKLWAKTGLQPSDIDVACLYDCFTYTVMATMEGYGFCEKGEVGKYFAEGRATYGGDVVVNPHGGLLSEGYIHGLNHYYEAALQLRGEAGTRQVDDAKLALVTAGAGPYGGANILSSDLPS
jgi:acetyl-CoA acetyltransferase